MSLHQRSKFLFLAAALLLAGCNASAPTTETKAVTAVRADLTQRVQALNLSLPGYRLTTTEIPGVGSKGGNSLDLILVPENELNPTINLPLEYDYKPVNGDVSLVYRPEDAEVREYVNYAITSHQNAITMAKAAFEKTYHQPTGNPILMSVRKKSVGADPTWDIQFTTSTTPYIVNTQTGQVEVNNSGTL